jgi:hypothetical protein
MKQIKGIRIKGVKVKGVTKVIKGVRVILNELSSYLLIRT